VKLKKLEERRSWAQWDREVAGTERFDESGARLSKAMLAWKYRPLKDKFVSFEVIEEEGDSIG